MLLKKIIPFYVSIFCVILFFSHSASAQQKFATLPGGLLYPQFSTAAFTNAAALTSDWYSEVQALYSPQIGDSSNPQSYFVGYATSTPHLGFNLGYLGSIQSGVAVHNLFTGLSARLKNHSFGVALRKKDLAYSTALPMDLSWMWNITHHLTFGLVGYDILENQTLAAGLGYEDYNRYSFEIDTQFPMPGGQSSTGQEYALTLASVFYFNQRVGISLGTRYHKWNNGDSQSSEWRNTFGTVIRLKRKISLVGLYTSSPDTFIVGFCWGNPASPQQWIDYWLARDRKGFNL